MQDDSAKLTADGVSFSTLRAHEGGPIKVVLTLGDPASVGAELLANLLALPAVLGRAQILVVADRLELEIGASIGGTTLDFISIGDIADICGAFDWCGLVLLHRPIGGDEPNSRATVSARNGRAALNHLTEAL